MGFPRVFRGVAPLRPGVSVTSSATFLRRRLASLNTEIAELISYRDLLSEALTKIPAAQAPRGRRPPRRKPGNS